ncbi:class I SAM-dependent methyltransferase [Candidatus Bathyarchaeota archaeon]|nr:class I SAM-dependent methyltransferase [Candidatus Bathyarchaeota archaeon]
MGLRYYTYEVAFSLARECMDEFSNDFVLDIGCGRGSKMDEFFLKRRFTHAIIGVDISQEMIKDWHSKTRDNELWKDSCGIVASA